MWIKDRPRWGRVRVNGTSTLALFNNLIDCWNNAHPFSNKSINRQNERLTLNTRFTWSLQLASCWFDWKRFRNNVCLNKNNNIFKPWQPNHDANTFQKNSNIRQQSINNDIFIHAPDTRCRIVIVGCLERQLKRKQTWQLIDRNT